MASDGVAAASRYEFESGGKSRPRRWNGGAVALVAMNPGGEVPLGGGGEVGGGQRHGPYGP